MGIYLVFGIMWSVVNAVVASNKGRNAAGWAIGGFFFGLIATIILACLSSKKQLAAGPAHTMIGVGAPPAYPRTF